MRFPTLAYAASLSLAVIAAPVIAEPQYNQVSLQAEASIEVPHDLMQVTFYTEAQDSDAKRLAEKITQSINNAIALSKTSHMKAVLGSRNNYPVYNEKGREIIAWRERAELRIESTDFAQLSQLTGELLQNLNIANMHFSIADATRLKHENNLIEQAIAAFNARAKLTTKALSGKSFKLVNLNLDSQGSYQPPMYRQAAMLKTAMHDAAIAPDIEAGSSQIRMIASGVIEVIE